MSAKARHISICLLVAFAFYVISYLGDPNLPGNNLAYPLGWWGWYDQSKYLESARAFAAGSFAPEAHVYPPLYAALAAPWVGLLKSHAFFVVDAICFLVFNAGLLWVGTRFYGLACTLLSAVFLLFYFPFEARDQWVWPWTSTLSATLFTILILISVRFWSRNWRLEGPRDWASLFSFYLAYGLIVPTRPLEVFVFFPLALMLYLRLVANSDAPPGSRKFWTRLCLISAVAAIGGLIGPSGFALFNKLVFGAPFGGYIAAVGAQGYHLADIPEKFYSLLINSETLYVEPGQSLFQKEPLLAFVFVLAAVSLATAPSPIRWIVATAFLHFLVYFPYADLLPHSLFRYANIHYFKWCFPWLALAAFGETRAAILEPSRLLRNRIAISAIVAFCLFCATTTVKVGKWDSGQAVYSSQPVTVSVHLSAPHEVSLVELTGVKGDLGQIDAGGHAVAVDGEELAYTRDFRIFPTASGIRLILIRPRIFSSITLRPGQRMTVDPGQTSARTATYDFCWLCRLTGH